MAIISGTPPLPITIITGIAAFSRAAIIKEEDGGGGPLLKIFETVAPLAFGCGGVPAMIGLFIGALAGVVSHTYNEEVAGRFKLGCYLIAASATIGTALGNEILKTSIDDHNKYDDNGHYPQSDFDLYAEVACNEFAIYDVI